MLAHLHLQEAVRNGKQQSKKKILLSRVQKLTCSLSPRSKKLTTTKRIFAGTFIKFCDRS
jgi:hypothetical protein